MVNGIINGTAVSVRDGSTILEAAKQAGINIPTLCYLKDINEIGACRVCVVEVKGVNRLVASCNTPFTEGMEVSTDTPRVIAARKMNVSLILSQHSKDCDSCVRDGDCRLQALADEYGIKESEFKPEPESKNWNDEFPLIRDAGKCIKCMRCVQICEKVQGLGVWNVTGTGSRTTIEVNEGRKLDEINCALCGQCITHCPTGALTARDDTKSFLGGNGRVSVVQVAPAVRSAFGEMLGLDAKTANEKRLVAALHKLGFKYVFDTNFSADLTIMEEGTEFLHRLGDKDSSNWPMFTSCCPGWVRFLKGEYPDMIPQLSTAKSPQQMFGAVAKTYFASRIGKKPEDIYCVSIMPCVAKKNECRLPGMDASGTQDVDTVLTTRELCRLIKANNIDVSTLPEEEFDSPLGTGTGAAVIFGTTGGVMEAALRSCYFITTGKNPPVDMFKNVKGVFDGCTESEVNLNGTVIRCAVVNGLGSARALIEKIRSGEARYDFVEVMACPGGCVGGGGQPIHDGEERAESRTEVLRSYDTNNSLRFSHENPDVIALYERYLDKPCSEKAHRLLHSSHGEDWTMPVIVKKQ